MAIKEPQSAADYDDRTTEAVRSVMIEMGQILGSYAGKFAIIGGAVPWLLLDNDDMPHVGTVDIDIGLDSEALADGEYAGLVESLLRNGYEQREGITRNFQLIRKVKASDGGNDIDIIIDFLRPRNVAIEKNAEPLIANFAVIAGSGTDLALKFNEEITLRGMMPDGAHNMVRMSVCTIPALLAMKGHALNGRKKHKDAYDVYYCIRNYKEGPAALARECRPLLDHDSAVSGYRFIDEKFETLESYGPHSVKQFVEETAALGERTADQWQQDAFGQVDIWLRELTIRS
ncbi:nucleotidyl transferase AbiEii/AbiGii toxin family protein [Phytobacter diazotrophicus]|uniref:Nucleotidyl transferase AbiEii/AbiGii toxin family protein n=1 Tax=Phytobacter ursingii TaxID=1972431 RepID=A0AB35RUY9_9ENTR|nr:nucleotidyl transferase AbiEii/AbiGii toxin family protein [Phytobacter ursingii]AUU93305.1 hypothetical protein C2U55_29490 [Enterobacteriaceae bacterium ENNIH3]MDU4155018.1 nucleotidyl transferase AbiEii/AbiGii toxin family protein [Enterobacteriaceae bacterium]QIH66903.1 hypothetical protein CRX67_28100 [Enterobacteriaceae bacterium A-F18]MDV2865815.1 nucleotidyl transferase AbiEii/AbiGii toxin family protein [Phytobacter ursingii]VTP13897.1 hypothetical protein PUATCC27989T_01746 [Phyto